MLIQGVSKVGREACGQQVVPPARLDRPPHRAGGPGQLNPGPTS